MGYGGDQEYGSAAILEKKQNKKQTRLSITLLHDNIYVITQNYHRLR